MNLWERIRVVAEIPNGRVYDLRHTYVSFRVNGSQSVAVAGKLLGQSKITTTQRYAHLAAGPIRQATDAIDDKVG